MSTGVEALGKYAVADILLKIARYDFRVDGDYSEMRRLGVVDIGGEEKILWRIFCYADELRAVEVEGTGRGEYRVMEIGLASEVCG